jgi:hypothetical protein
MRREACLALGRQHILHESSPANAERHHQFNSA